MRCSYMLLIVSLQHPLVYSFEVFIVSLQEGFSNSAEICFDFHNGIV